MSKVTRDPQAQKNAGKLGQATTSSEWETKTVTHEFKRVIVDGREVGRFNKNFSCVFDDGWLLCTTSFSTATHIDDVLDWFAAKYYQSVQGQSEETR